MLRILQTETAKLTLYCKIAVYEINEWTSQYLLSDVNVSSIYYLKAFSMWLCANVNRKVFYLKISVVEVGKCFFIPFSKTFRAFFFANRIPVLSRAKANSLQKEGKTAWPGNFSQLLLIEKVQRTKKAS